jgi:CRISPR-associated protein Cmr1
MRAPPTVAPPKEISKRAKSASITQIRGYELITPLFGGGVEPGFADPATIIRGPSIRGQLRFWWRACRGGLFDGDLVAMRSAEGTLWGTAASESNSSQSQVQIAVSLDDKSRGERFVVYDRRGDEIPVHHLSSPYGYAAFPLRDKPGRTEVLLGVRFTLSISFPHGTQPDIDATLWAWETFGGIGARTRRGFGALRLISLDGNAVAPLAPDPQAIERNVREQLSVHVAQGSCPDGVPHLSRNAIFKLTNRHENPVACWRYMIEALRRFRQQRPRGTDPKRPGRSKWPEPNAIRRLSHTSAPLHEHPLSTVDKFPRAALDCPSSLNSKTTTLGTRNRPASRAPIPNVLGAV